MEDSALQLLRRWRKIINKELCKNNMKWKEYSNSYGLFSSLYDAAEELNLDKEILQEVGELAMLPELFE